MLKKFAGIDVFDLEIDGRDPDRLVEIVAALEPTFGKFAHGKISQCLPEERKPADHAVWMRPISPITC